MLSLHLLAATQSMTLAGKLITYLIFPMLVVVIPASFIGVYRANKAAKARAVALAENAIRINARMDTQDGALARLLEVINPVGAPNLVAVLSRIQSDGELQAKRLDDHIAVAAADKLALEQRLAEVARSTRRNSDG